MPSVKLHSSILGNIFFHWIVCFWCAVFLHVLWHNTHWIWHKKVTAEINLILIELFRYQRKHIKNECGENISPHW